MYILKAICLNSIFYPLCFVFTLLWVLVCLAFLIVHHILFGYRKTHKKLPRVIKIYGYVIVRVLIAPFISVKYAGANAIKKGKSVVFVSNHRSFSDGFLMSLLPGDGVQVIKKWVLKIPIIGFVARLAGYPVISKMSSDEFLKKGCLLLREGVSVVGFPEGTRSENRSMGSFHGLLFRLALKAKCPIVPVCITGNENMPRKGSFFLYPGTIKIHQLEAIEWEDYKDMNSFQLKNMARNIMAAEIAEMEKN